MFDSEGKSEFNTGMMPADAAKI